MPLVSVVVPVYGNAAQLLALYERMSAAVAAESGVIAKLVFVDDGSPDASYEVLARTTSHSSAFDRRGTSRQSPGLWARAFRTRSTSCASFHVTCPQ
jgi:glycosyltransferase involved in cell wall biosynthesis